MQNRSLPKLSNFQIKRNSGTMSSTSSKPKSLIKAWSLALKNLTPKKSSKSTKLLFKWFNKPSEIKISNINKKMMWEDLKNKMINKKIIKILDNIKLIPLYKMIINRIIVSNQMNQTKPLREKNRPQIST